MNLITAASWIPSILGTCLALVVSYSAWQEFRSPLRKIPGPLVAKYTNLWRFVDVWRRRSEKTQISLHQRHGSAVRLGPHCVSLSDPQLIKTIYDTRGRFAKSEFYSVNDVKVGNRILTTYFSTRSNEIHNRHRNPVQQHYTKSAVLELEPLMDETIDVFVRRTDERFVKDHVICDMDKWLIYCAADIMYAVTTSKPMGFIETGKDVGGFCAGNNAWLDYFGLIGQIPALDNLFAKGFLFSATPPRGAFLESIARSQNRMKDEDGHQPDHQKDYLDHYIGKKASLDWVDDEQIVNWLVVNVMAGSDTAGISLCAIVYYVLETPRIQQRLHSELVSTGFSSPFSFKLLENLPYLAAVILEATRVHPGVGLPLERIVPPEGLGLSDGRYIPAGTIVGMNAWVVHQDKGVFGENRGAEEGLEAFQQRRSRMRQAHLTFGAGKRSCIGKTLALMELFKVTATLFARYEMELEHPKKEWDLCNSWFVRQSGIRVKIRNAPVHD